MALKLLIFQVKLTGIFREMHDEYGKIWNTLCMYGTENQPQYQKNQILKNKKESVQ